MGILSLLEVERTYCERVKQERNGCTEARGSYEDGRSIHVGHTGGNVRGLLAAFWTNGVRSTRV
jgi:hypothetical protein